MAKTNDLEDKKTLDYVDFTQRLLDGFWIPAAQTKVLGGICSFLVFFQLCFFKNNYKNATK